MANGTYFDKFDLGAAYAPLSTNRKQLTVTVSAPPSNSATAYLKGNDGGDVPLEPGEWHTLVDVDLSKIELKGTPGDAVTIVGGTW